MLVAFQHDKLNKKNANASTLNTLGIKRVRLYLNSQVYPYNMSELDFPNGCYGGAYAAYANIQTSYYNGADDLNMFAISYADFQTEAIFAFDTSRSDESLKSGSVDIRIEMEASTEFPAKTTCYCLIIYENDITYSPFNGLVVAKLDTP